ncbi:2,3-bisphosphoglycerate-independent phosphoglycerate mutase [Patescibacteria group bacterium]
MDKKVLLIILDGYGEGKKYKGNAVTNAKTPFIDKLRRTYPKTLLGAHGPAVGLPKGFQGGSEVGHYTIGAGKIVLGAMKTIDRVIKDGKLDKIKEVEGAIKNAKKNDSKLHLMGMVSDAGLHSNYNHLFALLKMAKKHKLKNVYIHMFMDGRDVPERSGDKFIKKVQKEIAAIGVGKISTMVGRYFAMDRDTNWNRTQKAYDLLTKMKGHHEDDPIQALKNQYKRDVESDYYIEPVVLDKNGKITKNDSVIFFNYRTDRASQLTEKFMKGIKPYFCCFGPYSTKAKVAFPAPKLKTNLGTILSKKNFKQLRIAETEKYAHVTFFFNSQDKKAYKGEKRILVPSAKVKSYASKPEMSAKKITSEFLKDMKTNEYKFVAMNFANGDLVGHSGDYKAALKAIQTLDECLSKVVPAAMDKGYQVLITGDHGNADYMIYEKNGDECPSHTLNPVIFMFCSNEYKKAQLRKKGGLSNVAPTILDLLGIKPPKDWDKTLIIKK